LFFVLLHHPRVNRWARGFTILQPFAVAFNMDQARRTPSRADIAPSKRSSVKKMAVTRAAQAKKAAQKALRTRIETELPRLALPHVEGLSEDDRRELAKELQNLNGSATASTK